MKKGSRAHTTWSPEAYVKHSGFYYKSNNGKPWKGFNWGMNIIGIEFSKGCF